MRLSIFWRLILTYLVIIGVMTAVNLYALWQIRTLAGLNTEVGSHHHPEIAAAKRLLNSFYEQIQSERKYMAVQAATFLEHFDEESKEFQQVLHSLLIRDAPEPETRLIKEVARLQQAHLALFHTQLSQAPAQQWKFGEDLTRDAMPLPAGSRQRCGNSSDYMKPVLRSESMSHEPAPFMQSPSRGS